MPVQDQDDGAAGIKPPKSMKKTEFYKAYKSKGSHQMYCDIMNDPCLRASAELLTRITRPLHRRYQDDLTAQQQGLATLREWNAQRCLGSSCNVTHDIIRTAVSASLYKAMRLSPASIPALPIDTTVLDEDFTLVNKAFAFGVHLAGNYAWSELLHMHTLPLAGMVLLAQNEGERRKGMSHMKRMIEAIVTAEDLARDRIDIASCLQDLAFQDEPFAREIMIYLKRGNYRFSDPNTAEAIKALEKFVSGSSSTKEILESTFGYLAHCVAKNSTNKNMGCHNMWMYLASSAFVASSGMQQHLPSSADWVRYQQQFGHRADADFSRFDTAFKASKTQIPTAPDINIPKTSRGVNKTAWRLSGPASHYRSSAAMAFLLDDGPNFEHAGLAWAGWENNHFFPTIRCMSSMAINAYIIYYYISCQKYNIF